MSTLLELMTKKIYFLLHDYGKSKALAMADSELARRYSHAVSLLRRYIVERYSAAGVHEGIAAAMIDVNHGEFKNTSQKYFYINPDKDAELDKLVKEMKKIYRASVEVHQDSMTCDVNAMDSLIRAHEIQAAKNPNAPVVLETKAGIEKIKRYRASFHRVAQVERDEIGRNLRSYLLSEIKRETIFLYNYCAKYGVAPLCHQAFNDAAKEEGRGPAEAAEIAKLSPPYVDINADYGKSYLQSLQEKYEAAKGISPAKKPTQKPTSKAEETKKPKPTQKPAVSNKGNEKQTPASAKPKAKKASAAPAADPADFEIEDGKLKKCLKKAEVVVIPDGVKIIYSNSMLKSRAVLREVVLPEGLTEIRSLAFSQFGKLEKINFPDSLKHIKENAFADCKSLTTVTLPKKMKKVAAYVFSGCENLEEVYIPEGVTHIDRFAFSDCSRLKTVSFPSTVQFIGNFAFRNCTSLSAVTLPKGCQYDNTYYLSFPKDCKVTFK